MNAALENISTAELEATLAARQTAAISKANEQQRQTWQAHEDAVQARKEANRVAWAVQSPYDWGTLLASAGIPVAAARIFAECLAVIFKRLTALESFEQRIKALENTQPAHMRDVVRR